MLRQAVDADGDSFKFQGLSVQSTSGSVLYFAGSWDRAHLLHSPALTELCYQLSRCSPQFWYR